jgi:hypothetical protein
MLIFTVKAQYDALDSSFSVNSLVEKDVLEKTSIGFSLHKKTEEDFGETLLVRYSQNGWASDQS